MIYRDCKRDGIPNSRRLSRKKFHGRWEASQAFFAELRLELPKLRV